VLFAAYHGLSAKNRRLEAHSGVTNDKTATAIPTLKDHSFHETSTSSRQQVDIPKERYVTSVDRVISILQT